MKNCKNFYDEVMSNNKKICNSGQIKKQLTAHRICVIIFTLLYELYSIVKVRKTKAEKMFIFEVAKQAENCREMDCF